MIVHVFNSSLVSGPETLVIPALTRLGRPVHVAWLRERRVGEEKLAAVRRYLEQQEVSWTGIDVHARCDEAAERKLAELLRDRRATIAHAHDVKASWLLWRAVRHEPKRPALVSTHHGVRARSGVRVRAYELFYRYRLLPRFDRSLAVCRSDYARLRRSGLHPGQLRLHLNGIGAPSVGAAARAEARRRARAAWGAGEGGPLLGVVARLAAEKRHGFLLEVLAEFRRRNPGRPLRVLCFGEGPLAGKLREKTRRLGLGQMVSWMGHRAHLGQELPGLDALLSFSRAEGLPINLLEAGWAELPVFATAVDGVRDLLPADQSAGYRLAPRAAVGAAAQALEDFLSRAPLAEMGRQLRKLVEERFSEEAWRSRLEEIYAELAPPGPEPGSHGEIA